MSASVVKSWLGMIGVATGLWALTAIQPEGAVGEGVALSSRPPAELVDVLRTGDVESRRQAATELGQLGPTALPALTPLLESLRDSDVLLRASASATLSRIGPAAVPALRNALRDQNIWVRRGVAYALSCLRDSAPETVAALTEALADADADVRDSAARGLAATKAADVANGTASPNDSRMQRPAI